MRRNFFHRQDPNDLTWGQIALSMAGIAAILGLLALGFMDKIGPGHL